MGKILVVYWSETGNTQIMAQAVADGTKEAGAEATLAQVSSITVKDALAYDIIAFGCPSMGAEELEQSEMGPFFSEMEGHLALRKIALFGSYDWGDGEWMRTWEERVKDTGANLLAESVICNLTPDDDGLAACNKLGRALCEA